MSTPILLEINHEEVSGLMEWSMQTEEVLGGVGRATIRVQDRTNTWEPECHWDVKASIRDTGWVLWRGEIVTEPTELPVGMPWRTWALDCADYNNELSQRLVGAYDGVTWEDVDGLGDYVNIDPYAHSLATDKLTVQALLDHYVRVDGEAVETEQYVEEYLTDFPTLFWSYTDVQRVLEEIAGGIAVNLQFWIDPDLKFHWVAVPAWQDTAQSLAALADDPNSAVGLAGLMPEGNYQIIHRPVGISDTRGAAVIGGRELKFTLDGSTMPEQVYVRGATGFVYNAPSVDPTGETVAINPMGQGVKSTEKYKLTFLASTKIWQTLSTGYLNPTFSTVAASGPYDVVFVQVPWNATTHKGGHFWKILTGPKTGYLVDNDTNYFDYGEITVERVVTTTKPPTVGVGGSGWSGGDLQDPNKRQAYLDAPISADEATRDALGGQALYRGSRPTLRGSIKVSGQDEWRAGHLVFIQDERLPASLNSRYFIIQRVQTNLIAGTDVREYVLDWGDGPTSRYTNQPLGAGDDGSFPPPVNQIVISAFDLAPGANSSQVIVGQLANALGGPWAVAGKVVEWTLEVYDNLGALVTGQGTLTPTVSATDKNGRARTTLKTGSRTNLVYFVFADVKVV